MPLAQSSLQLLPEGYLYNHEVQEQAEPPGILDLSSRSAMSSDVLSLQHTGVIQLVASYCSCSRDLQICHAFDTFLCRRPLMYASRMCRKREHAVSRAGGLSAQGDHTSEATYTSRSAPTAISETTILGLLKTPHAGIV